MLRYCFKFFLCSFSVQRINIRCKNGKISLVDFETVGLENNKVLIVFRDITDQKRIMEDKEELIKYLGQSNYELEIANKEKKKALLEIQSAKNELEEAYKKLEQALYNIHSTDELKLRILFVDDDPDNLLLIDKILANYKAEGSKGLSNGKEALIEFKNNPDYDLIILDIQTPEMDGTQCLNEIRKIDSKIPIIALTAHALRNDREKYLSMGFNDYFPKPIDFDSFRDLIAKYSAR